MSPFADSREHLWAELERIDQLVRAQTLRWRALVGNFKPSTLWGMVHVTDAEVDEYLASPFAGVEEVATPFVEAAAILRAEIDARVTQTPPATSLRLDALCRSFGLSSAERDVVLVCLLPELDARYRGLYGYLQDDASQSQWLAEISHRVAPAETRDADALGDAMHGFPAADVALSITAATLPRAWARWLRGCSASSAAFLLESLVRRPGTVEPIGEDLGVRLEPRPLDVVLGLAGYTDDLELAPLSHTGVLRFALEGP